MNINDKHFEFSKSVGKLIDFIYHNGYQCTLGYAYSDPRAVWEYGDTKLYSHPKITPEKRLSIDLTLFIGKMYITDGNDSAWTIIHDYWETLGGSIIIKEDPNHFSFTYGHW